MFWSIYGLEKPQKSFYECETPVNSLLQRAGVLDKWENRMSRKNQPPTWQGPSVISRLCLVFGKCFNGSHRAEDKGAVGQIFIVLKETNKNNKGWGVGTGTEGYVNNKRKKNIYSIRSDTTI